MKSLNSNQFYILENVSEEIVERLQRETEAKEFAKGEVIYQKGDPSDTFYFLLAGKAQLQVETDDGVTVILGILKVGYCFGITSIFPEQTCHHTVVCDDQCKVGVISGSAMRSIMEVDTGSGMNLLWNVFRLVKDRLDLRTDQLVKVLSTHPDVSKDSV